jgi:hypothetical protein
MLNPYPATDQIENATGADRVSEALRQAGVFTPIFKAQHKAARNKRQPIGA